MRDAATPVIAGELERAALHTGRLTAMSKPEFPSAVFATSLLAAVLSSLSGAAAAQEPAEAPARDHAPFQLSLWDSVQVIDSASSIHGVRLALPYGRNWDVHGLDVGVVNRVDHDLLGVQFSLVGIVGGDMKGYQNDWLWGSVSGEMQGVQMSAINVAGSLQGAQLGAVNYARADATGAGIGFVNVSGGQFEGAELGIVNYAPRVEGLQLGVVNVTEHLHGVQIGLVNVAANGFLPVFVILNAAL